MMKKVLLLAAVTVLAGCQTTKLDTPQAAMVSAIASKACIIKRGGDSPYASDKKIEEIAVHEIVKGKGGWLRADVSSRLVRGHIFINQDKNDVVCGYKNWDDRGVPFEKL